jgi:uncharacterized SAM-binding protein YcdF (DUF218 family)
MTAAVRRRSGPRTRATKARPWLLAARILAWLIVAGVVWCGYLLWLINSFDSSQSYEQADAGIILGAALWNDKPSPALKERLDFAHSLYEAGVVDKLILSGGLGAHGSTKTEAQGMRDYLLAAGMPADKLLLENEAKDTYGNLLYSQRIAQAEGLSRLLVITHDYHTARAREMAQQLDYGSFQVAGTASKVLNPVLNESREVLAFTKWKLELVLLAFGLRSSESML